MSLIYLLKKKNNATAAPAPAVPFSVFVIGDSTIAPGSNKTLGVSDRFFTTEERNQGYASTSIAQAGDTIQGQLSKWNANGVKQNYDLIFVQVGLNNMNDNISTTKTAYQNLINTINSTKKSGAKIFASCMLPCKSRWAMLGWANGQSNWIELNRFIMEDVTGVDYRHNAHVPLLDDGDGNLAPAYNSGDNIHENDAGCIVMVNTYRQRFSLPVI